MDMLSRRLHQLRPSGKWLALSRIKDKDDLELGYDPSSKDANERAFVCADLWRFRYATSWVFRFALSRNLFLG